MSVRTRLQARVQPVAEKYPREFSRGVFIVLLVLVALYILFVQPHVPGVIQLILGVVVGLVVVRQLWLQHYRR